MLRRRRQSNRELLLATLEKVEKLMTAVADLETAVTNLEGSEQAAAAEFGVLATEITELKAGTITEAQIESLAEKAAAVDTALKGATPAGTE